MVGKFRTQIALLGPEASLADRVAAAAECGEIGGVSATPCQSERPRVLLVDMMSGSNDYGRELVTCLAPRCQLTVVTVADSPITEMTNLCALPVFPPFGGRQSRWVKLLQSAHAFGVLTRELWRHRRDTVHVQFFRFQALDMLLYMSCLPALRCLVFTAHNVLPHEPKWWHKSVYRIWYRSVSCVQVLSAYARDRVIEFASLSGKDVWVVPHGNYASLRARTADAPVPSREDFGVSSLHRVGLFFGLVREYKGADLLIEAAVHLPATLPLTIVIAGGGEVALFEQYMAQAQSLGVAERFVFIPRYLSDNELAGLLRMCDFTVFPYRHIYQSGALMLAMTLARPIVASDLAGFREYVGHERQALLCNCDDPIALGHALKRITEDDELRDRLGRCALHEADSRYDWNIIAGQLIEMYDHQDA